MEVKTPKHFHQHNIDVEAYQRRLHNKNKSVLKAGSYNEQVVTGNVHRLLMKTRSDIPSINTTVIVI